jgi:hypothetical protein
MMTVVDIVVVKADVMGILVVTSREVNLFAIFDMIFKVSIIDHVVLRFSSVSLKLGGVRGLLGECGSDHASGNHRRVV